MNETTTNFSELDLSYEAATAHVSETIDQLNLLPPGSDKADTVERVITEYVKWRSYGEFATESGIHIKPPVYGSDFEEPEDDQNKFNIPSELGYDSNGEAWVIDFIPPYMALGHKEGNEKVFVKKKATEPHEDQKFLTIRYGLEGALDFITLVEAGMIPKPSNLVGVTNPTMARFSERAGLQTAASISDEMAHDEMFADEDMHNIDEQEARIQQSIHLHNEGLLNEDDTEETTRLLIKMAAQAKAKGNQTTYQDLTRTANNLMMNVKNDRNGGILVWGLYEDFREGVLDMKNKFGERVHRLAEREHATLAA